MAGLGRVHRFWKWLILSGVFLFQAFVCVWDFATGGLLVKHDSHKVRVESVVFSACESLLYSLGGQDDGQIVVFHIQSKTAICGELTLFYDCNAGCGFNSNCVNFRLYTRLYNEFPGYT